jgi:hypothetical protein
MVVAAAAMRGVPPATLLAAIDLDPQALLAADGRVAVEPAARAWQAAAELCGDPWFGLAVVEHLHSDYLGGLGLAVHGSATFGDALRRLARFFHVVNQRVTLELVEDGALVRVRLVIDEEVDAELLRHPTECLLAVLSKLARRATGTALVPAAVAFRHAALGDLAAYLRAFGIAPRFAQPWHEIAFPRAALDTPHLAPDGAMIAHAERHLHRQLDELPPVETFAGRARCVLLEALRLASPP